LDSRNSDALKEKREEKRGEKRNTASVSGRDRKEKGSELASRRLVPPITPA